MNAMVPLFAVDFGDVVRLLIVFVFLIVPVIARALAKIKQMPPPEKRPIPPRPPLPEVNNEIEEFLRRKAQRPTAQSPRPTIVVQQPPAPKPLRTQTVAQQRVGGKIDEPVLLDKPVGGQIGEHVKHYLDESDLSRREAELGKEVAQADREIDQRLHQKFDHRVSQLAAVPGEAAAAPVAYEPPDLVGASADIPASFATGLLDLVNDPESLRQAIVLNEILRRPEERWA
jgi:hypothetical protein